MDKYVLSCCSTSDMSEEYYSQRDIEYVCFHYIMDDIMYDDDLGKSMSFDEFYKKISDGATPTTSQVNVEEFTEFFEPLLKEGRDILHVCLSSGLSGVYNSANIAKDSLLEKYPDRKILIVDSLGASSGYGLLMDCLANLRDQGSTIEECYEWAEQNKLNIHHWFFSTDLTSYWRGGRISRSSAFVGQILNICPLMNMNDEGHLIPRVKIRTKKKAINEIVNRMEEHAKDGLEYSGKCFISQSACYKDARAVADLIEQRFPKLNGKVIINNIGTVIGSHTGPGTIAVFFYGDKREK
jgi:DegV family protein with EDD domain